MDLWTFFVVFSLCFCTQLQIVLAGEDFVTKQLEEWKETIGFNIDEKVADTWLYSTRNKWLSTDVKPGGASWFITPKLTNLPNTTYIEIEASCNKKPCQLEILKSDSDSFDKFEFVQNVTFGTTKQQLKIATIESSYLHLSILARVPMSSSNQIVFYIYSIKIRYYFCEKTKIYNTELSQVASSTTNTSKWVECPDDAVGSDGKSRNITVNCTPKGNWTFENITCVCEKGFQSKGQECSRCPTDYYKNTTVKDERCQKCPEGRKNNAIHTECDCKKGHYTGEDEDGPCYAVPSKVKFINIPSVLDETMNIMWKKANSSGFNGSITYTVKVYDCEESKCNKLAKDVHISPNKTSLTYVMISNLVRQKYKVKVISMNSLKNVPLDKWEFAETTLPRSETTPKTSKPTGTGLPGTGSPENSEGEKSNNIFIYVGAAGAFVVIVLFIVLILITRYRRGKSKKDGEENHGFENVPLSQRIYVDPAVYDDPEAALRDFANEISERNLKLERVIGGGEFGDVYKGILKTDNIGDIEVAVKTLKHDADARSRKDFFLEGSAMGQFDDPNVIHLEGVVTKSIPHMIVIEYMANGSLDNFLKQNDGQFTDLQLVGMARGVASGMKYLAAMNFVHRDLAARNILVNEGMLCKVADFGLSRELENADSSRGEYCATGGKIPVRWTAPEAIKYRKFSTASDVWSYGILLWEIMSFAERPYWDWDNFKLLERVDEGYRLPAPKNCPKAVHELMLLCWETSREKRPEFADIVRMLDDWIRSPETIRYATIPKRPVSGVGDPAMLIKEWLHDIKMSSYIPHFTQAGFAQISDLAGLADSDLQSIGVSLIGHRNKMLRTIRSLPITDETKKTPWNRATSMKV